MPEAVVCNLCGADDAKLLFRLHDYRFFVDDVEWTVVRCRNCGLGYVNPRPTVEEVNRYYPAGYFSDRSRQMERYRRQARYVPGMGGRLLDIGTARGDFLAVMRDRGWQVEGIEPSTEGGNPHGLPIYRIAFPEECDLPSETYDVITAWAVFEHLRDPREAFRMCARLLRPNGRLIVQVPNLRSIYSRWALQDDIPRHLHLFSEKTLRAYGAQAGLRLGRVVHTTDLFGGSGRGVLRLALVRACGRSTADFFEMWSAGRAERFQRWPILTVGWVTASAIEHVLLADWIVRLARISGQILAEFRRAPQ